MLNFEICRNADPLLADSDRWNALSDGNPFRQTQWLAPCWRNLGCDDQNVSGQLHEPVIVLATDHAGELHGALPLYRRNGGRTLGIMSDGSACGDFLGPLCSAPDRLETARSIGSYVGKIASSPVDGWDRLDFDGGVEGDETFVAFIEGLRAAGCTTHVSSRMQCWRRTKEATWDDHLRRHGKTQRRRMRKWLKKIDGPEGITRCVADTTQQFESLVNDVIDLHQKRWIAVGEPGSFADPQFRQFAIEMMLEFHAQDRAIVNAIAIDGKTIAGELILIGENRVGYTYSAGYDIDHADLEPGRIVAIDTIHHMYHDEPRFDAVDFMRGDEPYKKRFASQSARLYHLQAFAPEMPAKIRSAAYRTNFQVKQWLRRATGRDQIVVANL